VISAALAALALTAVASAQTATAPAAAPIPASRCPGFPPEPVLPDGATARSSRQMQEAEQTYQQWGLDYQAVLACRRTEIEEMLPVVRTHEARANEYNTAARALNAFTQNWVAEVQEYCTRVGPRVCGNQQQGGAQQQR
jgi:hypothetical protein